MTKTLSSAQVRRRRPYLGLDYFREQDAALFFERDDDSRHCAETLMGFGVKILILQGSTGAGKSSFLRAGLIPYLKKYKEKYRVYFLNDQDDDVIRCTSDPMKWIGRAVLEASRHRIAAAETANADGPDDTAAPCAQLADDAIFGAPRSTLAEIVLDTLECLCNEVPGQLMLVLDQAEEVLTQKGSDLNNDSSAAFFYFLSEVYIRNINVRIVVALRTEYYGRFRDELDIRDDRLSSRPRHGGVAPYLLRSIRDRDALIRIATAPASGESGRIYNYEFDPDAAGRIVDDILMQERHGSVTPLLQAVCAVLYDDLKENDRTIRLEQYERLGGIRGITNRYVEAGFRDVLGTVDDKVLARWYRLLYSLVSRQGGGTLVSEIETVDELRTRAANLEISGDVDRVLYKLCTSSSPLLRGQPPEHPTQFSLKHDVLAGFFFRWKVEEDATLAQQQADEERLRKLEQANAKARTRLVLQTLVLAGVVLVAVAALNMHDHFKTQINTRLELAAEPPRSDYALSLFALITALDATSAQGWLPFGYPKSGLRQQSIDALRKALLRSPWLDGKCLAAGMTPEGDRAILLQEDGTIRQLGLSAQAALKISPEISSMSLPPDAPKPKPNSNVAVGYLEGLGPSVLIEGQLYYWNGRDSAKSVKLQDRLQPSLRHLRLPRYEFAGGALLVTGSKRGPDGDNETYRLTITAKDILEDRIGSQKEESVAHIGWIAPAPVFAETASLADTIAYIRKPPEPQNGSGGTPGAYAVRAGRVGYEPLIDLSLPGRPTGQGNYTPFSPAFVLNDRALLVSGPTGDAYWFRLPAGASPGRTAEGPGFGTISVAALAPVKATSASDKSAPTRDKTALVPAEAYTPWIYSPLAAVQLPGKLRFAWLSGAGIWVAEARPVPNRSVNASPASGVVPPLLVGEPGGSRLRFSRTGDFLVLQQQPHYGGAIQVRVWNLSPRWKQHVEAAKEEQLLNLACDALKQSQQDLKDAKALGLFKLPGVSANRCEIGK
jgi:hypothetical protein